MIGEIIRKARVSKKLTTSQLAEKAKVTQSMVSRYESGKVIPTKRILMRLYKALEVDTNNLDDSFDSNSEFDQKDFDSKLAKARTLGVEEKKTILTMVNAFLKIRDTEVLVSNWNPKA